mmetsp:Transcript_112957/g.320374  ORF Transcript_112957/g.320374 Transcript_112957/m.320374 type:complete len:83 (-) Transcript_112957:724-972(-)
MPTSSSNEISPAGAAKYVQSCSPVTTALGQAPPGALAAHEGFANFSSWSYSGQGPGKEYHFGELHIMDDCGWHAGCTDGGGT